VSPVAALASATDLKAAAREAQVAEIHSIPIDPVIARRTTSIGDNTAKEMGALLGARGSA